MTSTLYAGKKGRLAILFQRVVLVVLLNAGATLYASAQCLSTTAHSGTVFTSDNSTGNFQFNNTGNASASDNQYATANALAAILVGTTQPLKITGFNFSVPTNAVICGVTMTMEARATGLNLLTSVKDNKIQLVKNGAVTGTSQAKGTGWPGTKAAVAYGSTTSLWDAFLTPTDVNSAQFGIAISAAIKGVATALPSVQIDYVSMTVHYSVSNVLPLHVTDFNTSLHNNTVVNHWQVTSAEPDATITLQRSIAGEQWQVVARNALLHTGHYEHSETITGAGTYYYRLQLHTANGVQYSKTNRVVYNASSALRLYPNPAGDYITLTHTGPFTVYNSNGQNIEVPVRFINGVATLNVHALPPGLYWLKAGAVTQRFLKN